MSNAMKSGIYEFGMKQKNPIKTFNLLFKFAGPWPSWRVRSSALSFDISPFHFFELFSKLLQSKPTQAAIFKQFFDLELQSTQTWTQIRTKLGLKFEPQFELELKSNLNSSSSNCLLLFSAPARRRPL